MTRLPEVLGCLEQAAFRAPVDIRVAFHSLDEGRRGLSGVGASAKISQAEALVRFSRFRAAWEAAREEIGFK